MRKRQAKGYIESKLEFIIGGLIFGVTLLIFWLSPVYQMTDSGYAMVLSESLLYHHSFMLDRYGLDRSEVQNYWRLEQADDHLYYRYPPGTSVLSLPFVAVMNALHMTAAKADGTYKPIEEARMQAALASLLMALLASIFFFTSRLLLPLGWSLLIALGGALGTQVWSTASRAMWSHTWEILLLGIVLWMLLAQETGKRSLNPWVLASLLSWMYFVRPTSSIVILAVTVYVFVFHRRIFFKYAAVGAVWLAVFIVYSWQHFHQLLPSYFRMLLNFRAFRTSLAGVLISPSRGLLIYVPVVLFLFYLVVRYWGHITYRRLVWLALFVVIAHLIVVSGSPMWWGGACFGARLTTDLVPWFVLLGILAIRGMLRWRAEQAGKPSALTWRTPLILGGLLLMLSVFINARGALSSKTWDWTIARKTFDEWMVVFWDWRYPQFMAGLIHPPTPGVLPPPEIHIDLGTIESDKYIWYGWGVPETQFRWTDGYEATLVFGLDRITDTTLQVECIPFLANPRITEQTVHVELNGHRLTTWTMRETLPNTYSILLPRDLLSDKNVLLFGLPNATSLKALKLGDDERQLGIAVEWIEFRPQGVGK